MKVSALWHGLKLHGHHGLNGIFLLIQAHVIFFDWQGVGGADAQPITEVKGCPQGKGEDVLIIEIGIIVSGKGVGDGSLVCAERGLRGGQSGATGINGGCLQRDNRAEPSGGTGVTGQ